MSLFFWELKLTCAWPFFANSERPIQDYAKSSLVVAEYHMRIPGGDLHLAKDYVERVAGSNAEDVGRASEFLKTVKLAIQTKAFAEADARVDATMTSDNVPTAATAVGSEPIETPMATE